MQLLFGLSHNAPSIVQGLVGGGGVQKCYQYDSFLSPIKFAEDPTYFLGLFLGVHATETMMNRQPCGMHAYM